MLDARAALRLIRFDASAVIFLSIFVPVFARTRDLGGSLLKAAPMFLIGACTWIANDLNDMERDRINHSGRPLPAGRVSPEAAAILYFVLLLAALLITHNYVPATVALWYYLVLTLSLSYGYVVDLFPSFKALYVGAAMSVPVTIVERYNPTGPELCLVAVATFCFASGKELCMDILDRRGDTPSLLHRVSIQRVAVAAFGLQFIGLAMLLMKLVSLSDIAYWATMAIAITVAAIAWFAWRRFKLAVAIVRIQLLLGLYFLV